MKNPRRDGNQENDKGESLDYLKIIAQQMTQMNANMTKMGTDIKEMNANINKMGTEMTKMGTDIKEMKAEMLNLKESVNSIKIANKIDIKNTPLKRYENIIKNWEKNENKNEDLKSSHSSSEVKPQTNIFFNRMSNIQISGQNSQSNQSNVSEKK